MRLKITVENVDEFITSYIDKENRESDIDKQVNDMLGSDNLLYKKYKSEFLTKQFFSSKLSIVEVPVSTVLKLRNSLDELVRTSFNKEVAYDPLSRPFHNIDTDSGFLVYLKQILVTPIRIRSFHIPRYAFAVVIAVIMLGAGILINSSERPNDLNPYVANGSDRSVMVQAVNNFHKVLSGDIKPQLNTSNAAEVKNFCKSKVNFDVYVPSINNYDLIGAVQDEYNGQKLIHLVYISSDGNELIYIYETCISSIKRKDLELPDPVHTEMVNSKFYMCDKVDNNNCTLIMWYKNDVLCASVSTMPKHKMYSSFENFK